MIRIGIDAPNSVGMNVNIDGPYSGGTPTDADILSLAETVLASDYVQHSPQWNGTPALTSVGVDGVRGIYPTA